MGSQIRHLMNDKDFEAVLRSKEKVASLCFKSILIYLLGNNKGEKFKNSLYSHLVFFPNNWWTWRPLPSRAFNVGKAVPAKMGCGHIGRILLVKRKLSNSISRFIFSIKKLIIKFKFVDQCYIFLLTCILSVKKKTTS